MIPPSVKVLGAIVAWFASLVVGTVLDMTGAGTPVVIGASCAAALAVIVVLRRIVTSQIAAGTETINGLRSENDRLRQRLAEYDDNHDNHEHN